MKYRVAQLSNGKYQTQFRIFYFFWLDTIHGASDDLKDQIRFAKYCEYKEPKFKIVKVVWP